MLGVDSWLHIQPHFSLFLFSFCGPEDLPDRGCVAPISVPCDPMIRSMHATGIGIGDTISDIP